MPERPVPEDPQFELLDTYLAALQAGDRERCARWRAEYPQLAELAQCLHLLDQFVAPESEPPPYPASAQTIDALEPARPGTAPAAPARPPGDRPFGKYDLLEEIGRGGMGVVFKARQRDLNRTVAVKMILASHLAGESEVTRFYREARAAGSLRHPQIVGIHEVGEIDGQHYFAMDYIAGTSLAELPRSGPLPADRVARLLIGVARAVQFLHDHGIVHRDLKPSNILIDAHGTPLVTDFGLAKIFAEEEDRTLTGTTLGTPAYMSPEQAAGRIREVSARSDVYGLGAILYELLTGRPPFREETPHQTILQVLERDPPLPSQINRQVPLELERVCLKCLEKQPEARYQSAAQLADDLDRFLRREPLEARPASLFARFHRWVRRETGLASRLAILLAALLVTQLEHVVSQRPWGYHWKIKLAFLAWALLALVFQWFLRRGKTAEFARLGWAVTDPVFLLYILTQAEQVETLLVGYPVVITASGLWFREKLVYVSTASCILSYAALLVCRQTAIDLVHYPLIFMLALCVIGGVVAFQVHRIRTLNRYFEQSKPDPAP